MTGLGTADGAIGVWAKKVNGSRSRRGSGTRKNIERMRGKVVPFSLADAGRTVVAYVVTRDSPAKKEEGKEVIFQVCSDRCGLELTVAMHKEMNLLS
jgi:hypothetical protein